MCAVRRIRRPLRHRMSGAAARDTVAGATSPAEIPCRWACRCPPLPTSSNATDRRPGGDAQPPDLVAVAATLRLLARKPKPVRSLQSGRPWFVSDAAQTNCYHFAGGRPH